MIKEAFEAVRSGEYTSNDPRDKQDPEAADLQYTFDIYKAERKEYIAYFRKYEDAVEYAKTLSYNTYIIFNPNDDRCFAIDPRTGEADFSAPLDYPYTVDPGEVVWDSKIND